ncbi:MAG: hypothetical protein H6733_06375 [Alphaproteobacteria bacterium]|nr:hypothetical protein [Alphaproteobacteria bacterium]
MSGALPLFLATLIAPAAHAALPPVPTSVDNPVTPERVILGKILFWDEQLSSDNTVACGTCHLPEHIGGDPRPAVNPGPDGVTGTGDDRHSSLGVIRMDTDATYVGDPIFGFGPQVTPRTTPAFLGTLWAPQQFWDGRSGPDFVDPISQTVAVTGTGGLEAQAIVPILSDVEMGHPGRSWSDVVSKLAAITPLELGSSLTPDIVAALSVDPTYPDLFTTAFGDPAITPVRIGLALAAYERTLVPDDTVFDVFFTGVPTALDAQQTAGWEAFRTSQCAACHRPPLFTDNSFRNIGLRPVAEDKGRQDFTNNPADRGKFKVPSLRNIALRDRFMHNGQFTTLEEVLDFYTTPALQQHDNQDVSIPLIALTAQQETDILYFLRTALLDPRVAAGDAPFDRPDLHAAPDACSDGVDNDGDGLTDTADLGCISGADTSEWSHVDRCDDGQDDDHDGLLDAADPDCDAGDFTLTAPTLVAGQRATLTIDGAAANAQVYVLVSLRGPGVGPCPAPGVCLDIRQPTLVGSVVTDRNGHGTVRLRVPATVASGTSVAFQAGWFRAGQGAASTVALTSVQ